MRLTWIVRRYEIAGKLPAKITTALKSRGKDARETPFDEPVELDGSGALRRGGYGSHAAEHANDVTVDERSANAEADRCNGA